MRFLLIRMGLYLLAFALAAVLAKAASLVQWAGAPPIPHDYVALLRNGLLILVAFALYAVLVRALEKRPAGSTLRMDGVKLSRFEHRHDAAA